MNKATLKEALMGKTPGEYELVSAGTSTVVLRDSGGEFQVPAGAVTLGSQKAENIPTKVPTPVSEEPVEPLDLGPGVENFAKAGYDAYTKGVGGVAFNGDPLPGSEEFFADPRKQKQANGWRLAADAILSKFMEENIGEETDPQGNLLSEVEETEDATGQADSDESEEESTPEEQLEADESGDPDKVDLDEDGKTE